MTIEYITATPLAYPSATLGLSGSHLPPNQQAMFGTKEALQEYVKKSLPEAVTKSSLPSEMDPVVRYKIRKGLENLSMEELGERVRTIPFFEKDKDEWKKTYFLGGSTNTRQKEFDDHMKYNERDPMHSFRFLMQALEDKMREERSIPPAREQMEMVGVYLRRLMREISQNDHIVHSNLHKEECERLAQTIGIIERKATNTPTLHYDLRYVLRGIRHLSTLKQKMSKRILKSLTTVEKVAERIAGARSSEATVADATKLGTTCFSLCTRCEEKYSNNKLARAFKQIKEIEVLSEKVLLHLSRKQPDSILERNLVKIISTTEKTQDWVVKALGIFTLEDILVKTNDCHLQTPFIKALLTGEERFLAPLFSESEGSESDDSVEEVDDETGLCSALSLITSYAIQGDPDYLGWDPEGHSKFIQDLAQDVCIYLGTEPGVVREVASRALFCLNNYEEDSESESVCFGRDIRVV